MTARLIGLLIFAGATCVAIVLAGGGAAFLQRPVGLLYLLLWAIWWLVIALGRQRGTPSAYDHSQRVIMTLGIAVLVGLIVALPWEYAHRAGPIPRDGLLAWAGLALFAAGICLQAAAMAALHGLYTSRLGIQPGHRLVTAGPYRWVRHPGYLSNLMCLAGMALALSSLLGLALTLATVPLVMRRLQKEEDMLAAELGEAYRAYQGRTSRLIPGIY